MKKTSSRWHTSRNHSIHAYQPYNSPESSALRRTRELEANAHSTIRSTRDAIAARIFQWAGWNINFYPVERLQEGGREGWSSPESVVFETGPTKSKQSSPKHASTASLSFARSANVRRDTLVRPHRMSLVLSLSAPREGERERGRGLHGGYVSANRVVSLDDA